MTDDQIYKMLEKVVEEIDYDIYKEMFVFKDRESDRLVEIVKEHLGKAGKTKKAPAKKKSGRVFAPITVNQLKEKMKAFIYPHGGVDISELYEHVEKDIKVKFDFENYSDASNANSIIGFNKLSNGLTFYGVWCGGDWESAVTWIVYWDGKRLRGYVPTDGNPWNTDTKEAFGNDDTADFKNAKKRWPELMKDMTEEDLDGFFDSNNDEMIEDIKARILKK